MSKSLVERLVEARQRTWHEAKALLDSAEAEGRSMTGEERSSWERMMTDLDQKDSDLQAVRKNEERDASVIPAVRVPAQREGGLLTEARNFIRGEQRTLTVADATHAGDTLSATFVKNLYEVATVNSAVLSAGPTVINTSSGEQLTWPVTNAQSAAVIYSENTQVTGNEPTFTQKSLYAYKYGFLMTVTRELAEDTQIDLLGYLSRQAGVAIGNGCGNDYVNGAGHGSGQPNGLVTATVGSSLGKTGASGQGGSPSADELIDLFYSVSAPYRANGTWLLKDSTVAAVRKLKGVSSEYLWTPGLGAAPDTILGRPVITDPYMPTVANSAKSVIFGDFSQYYVRRAGGVRFEASQDFKFDYDVTVFKVTARTDGCLFDTSAIKHFIGNAA